MNIKNKKPKYGVRDLQKDFGELTFADVLRAHRESEELTQQEMANFLEITKQSLCDLEKGRKIPSLKRAESIARKFGMLPESFIELALQDQLRKLSLNYSVSIVREKHKRKKVS